MRTWILIVVFLTTTTAFAEEKDPPPRWEFGSFHMFEGWSTTDRTLFGTFTFLNVIDIGQTRYAFSHDKYKEANPILAPLGKNGATAVMLGVNVGLYFLLDIYPQNRTTSLGIMNFLKVAVVGRNFQIGVGLEF